MIGKTNIQWTATRHHSTLCRYHHLAAKSQKHGQISIYYMVVHFWLFLFSEIAVWAVTRKNPITRQDRTLSPNIHESRTKSCKLSQPTSLPSSQSHHADNEMSCHYVRQPRTGMIEAKLMALPHPFSREIMDTWILAGFIEFSKDVNYLIQIHPDDETCNGTPQDKNLA